jgi:tetratricopeptide (TPR) repeat protein
VGEYDRAIDTVQKILAIADDGVLRTKALLIKARSVGEMGDINQARIILESARDLGVEQLAGVSGYAYVKVGQLELARPLLETDILVGVRGYVAAAYALIGDIDRAFELLEEGIEDRDRSVLTLLRSSPDFAELRHRPRYRALNQRLATLEKRTISTKATL